MEISLPEMICDQGSAGDFCNDIYGTNYTKYFGSGVLLVLEVIDNRYVDKGERICE